jgi:hypothetical protein
VAQAAGATATATDGSASRWRGRKGNPFLPAEGGPSRDLNQGFKSTPGTHAGTHPEGVRNPEDGSHPVNI